MKWRFCEILVFSKTAQEALPDATQGIGKILFPDDSMSSVWRFNSDEVGNELARLGWDGWELVSHVQILEYARTLVPSHEVYMLKKQEPED